MLERSAGKLARSVLRGERSREAPDLPGDNIKRKKTMKYIALGVNKEPSRRVVH